jgi:hypothetical protein
MRDIVNYLMNGYILYNLVLGYFSDKLERIWKEVLISYPNIQFQDNFYDKLC